MLDPTSVRPDTWLIAHPYATVVLGAITTIVVFLLNNLIQKARDRKARLRLLAEKPITSTPQTDWEGVARLSEVTSLAANQPLEPWILPQTLASVFQEIPRRLVLIGPKGIGKSRIAAELSKTLQRERLGAKITFLSRKIPLLGSLTGINLRSPILVVDDVRPRNTWRKFIDEDESTDFGNSLAKLLLRISVESGEQLSNVNVILTVLSEHEKWLRAELDALEGFTFINIPEPIEDDKRKYVSNLLPAFSVTELNSDAIEQLTTSKTYRVIFECLRDYSSTLSAITPEQVAQSQARQGKVMLERLPPQQQILLLTLTILTQFEIEKTPLSVHVLFAAGLRQRMAGRLTIRPDSVERETLAALGPVRRSWRRTLLVLRNWCRRFDFFCDRECNSTIVQSKQAWYVSETSGRLTSDQQSTLALAPNAPVYPDELKATITQFKRSCKSSTPSLARAHWTPLLIQTGELLFKIGLFDDAITLNKWLLALRDNRLKEPAPTTRSELLHYIGVCTYNANRRGGLHYKSADFYLQALDADPNNVKAMHSLAVLYRDYGEYYYESNLYHKILTVNPPTPQRCSVDSS